MKICHKSDVHKAAQCVRSTAIDQKKMPLNTQLKRAVRAYDDDCSLRIPTSEALQHFSDTKLRCDKPENERTFTAKSMQPMCV
eukprot:CAMPEP_0206144154 /NCGR_PEP_ID=MMETSP1473-20131121/23221_1 /ASSEMBLY_ACC=CAM_ASM_001109 /TAXON_ID=1461547 /ORGANISM="Stichococcus sp, Strain RCC1054" /LENGTH=82 /DNA_ID=CAMNT_0053539885 /DNA_START=147 /DNA_END=392 /DNA_ORIENTATION=+